MAVAEETEQETGADVDEQQEGLAAGLVTGGLPFLGMPEDGGSSGSPAPAASKSPNVPLAKPVVTPPTRTVAPSAANLNNRERPKKEKRNGIDSANGISDDHGVDEGREHENRQEDSRLDRELDEREPKVKAPAKPEQKQTEPSQESSHAPTAKGLGQNGTSGAANTAGKTLGSVDSKQIAETGQKLASGNIKDAAKDAAAEAVDVAEKAGSNYLFEGMLVLVIPTFGLIILVGDIVYGISKFIKIITGQDLIKLSMWQKMIFIALNFLILMIILIIFMTIYITYCTGFTGVAVNTAAKVGLIPDICKVGGLVQ